MKHLKHLDLLKSPVVAAVAVVAALVLALLFFTQGGNAGAPNAQAANFSASNFSGIDSKKGENILAQVSVKNGDKVSVDYVGTLEDGTVFDTSVKAVAEKAGLPLRPSYEPLSFTVGAGQMIKGFDAAVVGMKAGEEKTVKIPAKEAYGERSNANVMIISTSQLEQMLGAKPGAGMALYSNTGARGKIVSTNATETEVDFNHELAGKALVFKITIRKIGA